jgi:putative DNA primase/helicase
MIAAAKLVPIESELARRSVVLKRVGRELVGPCPACGGRDRFAVNVGKRIWNCRGCQKGGDVVDLVRHLDGVGFAAAVEILTGEKPRPAPARTATPKVDAGNDDYEQRQQRKAAWLWAQRRPIAGSIAERYLREARGCGGALPPTLAFLPPGKPEHHAALIAAFNIPHEPEPGILGEPRNVDAVHLTLLERDGSGKAEIEKPKIVVGRPLGRPIVLAPPNDRLALSVTEGIEDALTAHQVLGLGAWAAGSAGFMPALADIVPDYIEAVTIFGHPDRAGQDNAAKLARALDRRGIEVFMEGLA